MNWHTKEEKRIIEEAGGKALTKYGTDGVIDGKPVEVRSIRAKDETRYRLMKTTHKDLLKRGGDYIFVLHGKARKKSAASVDKIIKKRRWYKDRTYPHTFIYIKEVFTGKERGKMKKKTRRTCLEHSQLKMLFDVLRKKRKCNAATEYISQIDEEFAPKKIKKKVVKRKRSESFWEGWL